MIRLSKVHVERNWSFDVVLHEKATERFQDVYMMSVVCQNTLCPYTVQQIFRYYSINVFGYHNVCIEMPVRCLWQSQKTPCRFTYMMFLCWSVYILVRCPRSVRVLSCEIFHRRYTVHLELDFRGHETYRISYVKYGNFII